MESTLATILQGRGYLTGAFVRAFPEAIFYPLIYWTLMSTITTIYTIGAFVRRGPRLNTWRIKREDAA